ncbi:helix-turn-helix domain-containing protein [Streptomyces niveus]|uniref:helix-turn-helix domain-containing protein n=1 Tax=Streptomyces niveus TaxID=193462 RepID=UPI003424A457
MRSNEDSYLLVSRDLLVLLMERTGDGSRVTVRELADEVGVHPSKIGHLRTGEQETLPRTKALACARRLGVDELVLWKPTGRAVCAPLEEPHIQAVPA